MRSGRIPWAAGKALALCGGSLDLGYYRRLHRASRRCLLPAKVQALCPGGNRVLREKGPTSGSPGVQLDLRLHREALGLWISQEKLIDLPRADSTGKGYNNEVRLDPRHPRQPSR
jgi:hypothetical protein